MDGSVALGGLRFSVRSIDKLRKRLDVVEGNISAQALSDRRVESSSSYHHGDLRAALLSHADDVIERTGYEELELRELAALAGVSRSAPYRHFESRKALLTAIGIRGFRKLEQDYAAIAAGGGPPRQRLVAAVMHYLQFAAERPQLFRLMFVSDMHRKDGEPAEWTAAAVASFDILESLMAQLMPGASANDVRTAMLSLWMCKYGFAVLRMTDRFKHLTPPSLAEDTVLQATLAKHIPRGLQQAFQA